MVGSYTLPNFFVKCEFDTDSKKSTPYNKNRMKEFFTKTLPNVKSKFELKGG